MLQKSPLISVILPVYNGEKFLSQAIQSCLDQTYISFELIIVNDASSDRSLEIARDYQKRDERIKIFTNKENLKLPRSLNRGHKEALGKYITWTSDDNLLKPNFLDVMANAISSSECDLIYSDFDIIWENGELKRKHKAGPTEEIVFGDVIGASFLYSSKVYEELGGFDPQLFLVEDFDFFIRAATEFKFSHLEANLYSYRLHSNSLTSKVQLDTLHITRHREALQEMYSKLGRNLNFNKKTVDFLIKLYFREELSVKEYLKIKEIVKNDLLKFENSLEINEKSRIVDLLNSKIFWSWFKSGKDFSVWTFIQVLKSERSILLNPKNNKNAVIRLLYNCLVGKKEKV